MDSPATKHSWGAALCTPGCGHLFLNMYIVIVIVHAERGFLWYGAGFNLEFLFFLNLQDIFFLIGSLPLPMFSLLVILCILHNWKHPIKL